MSTPARAPRPVTPVGILAALLEDVRLRVDALDGADDALRADLDRACALAGGLDPYLDRVTSPEAPELARLDAATRARDWEGRGHAQVAVEQEMLSGHVEGAFLAMLVHATRARRVLDVGMFTGYSALAMARALPADGVVVACELDADVAAFAHEQFAATAAGGRVDVRVGPARDTLAELAGSPPFDLVFVDADKAGYRDYLDLVLSGGLLAAHGLVAVDNTLMQGEPWVDAEPGANGAAVAAFNDALAADPRVEQVLVPLRDGITLIRHAGPPVP